MKRFLFILTLATLAFVGCTKDGGETTDNEKLVLTNSQWIVKEATELLEPQENYAMFMLFWDIKPQEARFINW